MILVLAGIPHVRSVFSIFLCCKFLLFCFFQAFHVCALGDMDGGLLTYSFLCPNGTIFNQEYFICDW